MKTLWVFLALVVIVYGSWCRICIDESVSASQEKTISDLVHTVSEYFKDSIPNCNATGTNHFYDCENLCLSADFYRNDDFDSYIGSLRSCDKGDEYYEKEYAAYLPCSGYHCNDEVPIDHVAYATGVFFYVAIIFICSMVAVYICIMCCKTLKSCFKTPNADIKMDALLLHTEVPIHIELDELDNAYDEVGNRSILV